MYQNLFFLYYHVINCGWWDIQISYFCFFMLHALSSWIVLTTAQLWFIMRICTKRNNKTWMRTDRTFSRRNRGETIEAINYVMDETGSEQNGVLHVLGTQVNTVDVDKCHSFQHDYDSCLPTKGTRRILNYCFPRSPIF